jgi:uncharacterized protein
MKNRLKAWLPTPETIRNNRWLRWLGPLLHQPRLWHFSRRGIALGLAIGIFFGLLIPVAQIPFAATLAVLARANLPVAVASTLVTNPVTFGPVYYGAYRLGQVVLGQRTSSPEEAAAALAKVQSGGSGEQEPADKALKRWWQKFGEVGKPLVVGLGIVATAAGFLSYAAVSLVWALRVRWQRRRRLNQRGPRPAPPTHGKQP